MTEALSPSAQKVQTTLQELGLDIQVVELPASTRTAVEAAQAIGCQVGQIAKSLLFKKMHSGEALLVVASGSNRVNEEKIGALIGESIGKADADFVRQQTGFVIGGVPPVGHNQVIHTLIDEDLMQYTEIWAAAGTPKAVFRLLPTDLQKITLGQVVQVK
jgi:prolyl-tRNA editing enzyme YbaK/EbsC (Cys-tRNA(Pro) deacylase)